MAKAAQKLPDETLDPTHLAVQYRKVADLKPYAKNARTHSEEQVARIAKSIGAFGWTNPILVDGESGILAGHGRLAAATLLAMDEVPVIELSGLSETQKKAYVLADNQLALNAGWDIKILTEEVQAIEAAGIDLSLLGNIDLTPEPAGEAPPDWKTPVIKFNITFDDERQQQAWFEFVRRLQQEYPSIETLAGRLVEFLTTGAGRVEPEKAAA